MPDQVSHLSQNLEVHHNYLELVDYYHQVSKLFHGYELGGFGSTPDKNSLTNIQNLFFDIQKLESYIALKHFPLINTQSFDIIDPKSTAAALLYSIDNRIQSLEDSIANYYPSASLLLKKNEALSYSSKTPHPLSAQCWQQLSFDIGLLIQNASAFEQAKVNKTVYMHLKNITTEPHPWSPHRANQKIVYTFERIHFMVSKLQSLVRLRTTLEGEYNDTLGELVSLSQILKDFETKIIKQKRAEEKRVIDMYHPPALKVKK